MCQDVLGLTKTCYLRQYTVARVVKLKSETISLLAKTILLERIRLYETETLWKGVSNEW